jgi:HKD family nuclease
MKVKLLAQGYNPKNDTSLGTTLIDLLQDSSFRDFTIFSAFASASAVKGLKPFIDESKKHLTKIKIVVGVDQKGTSEEALFALLDLELPVFIYYQPSNGIFHPKLYLFEGAAYSKLIIGSSNLTTYGLFVNTEASLLIETDSSKEDKKLIQDLKKYFEGIFDETDKNLQPLTKDLIKRLVEKGIVPSESEQRKSFQENTVSHSSSIDSILDIFPKRIKSAIPKEFITRISKIKNISPKLNQDFDKESKLLLWKSNPLTERDLNIPTGSTTNPTGSMLFKKGQNKGIDQRHFFRDEVFNDLDWEVDSSKTHLERAFATFDFYINEKFVDTFSLRITHNTRTDSKAYLQKNSMTQISWGEAKSIVAQKALLGKIATLYQNMNTANRYSFVIA